MRFLIMKNKFSVCCPPNKRVSVEGMPGGQGAALRSAFLLSGWISGDETNGQVFRKVLTSDPRPSALGSWPSNPGQIHPLTLSLEKTTQAYKLCASLARVLKATSPSCHSWGPLASCLPPSFIGLSASYHPPGEEKTPGCPSLGDRGEDVGRPHPTAQCSNQCSNQKL